MCVSVHVCVFVCINVCLCVCLCVYKCVCVCVFVCINVCVFQVARLAGLEKTVPNAVTAVMQEFVMRCLEAAPVGWGGWGPAVTQVTYFSSTVETSGTRCLDTRHLAKVEIQSRDFVWISKWLENWTLESGFLH